MAPVYKNFIYNEERGFIFAYVPKVACTNWKSLLRYMAGHADWLDNKLAHDKEKGGLHYLDLETDEATLLNSPVVKKFAMVRNPYSRVLSAYLNKVENRLPPKPEAAGEDHFDKVVRDIDAFRRDRLGGDFPEINFEVFLHWLRDSGSWFTNDEHWAPQVALLRYPEVTYTFIGRFENLDTDAGQMLQEMGCDKGFPSQKDVKFAPTNAKSKVELYFNETCYALVNEIFHQDFLAFSYPMQGKMPGMLNAIENRKAEQLPVSLLGVAYVDANECKENASDAIQSAINSTMSSGGGTVVLSSGVFEIFETIILPSRVILKGQGSATILRLADKVNAAVVESEGFNRLTGSNSWFHEGENVPIRFGLISLKIDGNRRRNDNSPGVRVFGKKYVIRDVFIESVSGVGFYSECGDQRGQDGAEDMPECIIDNLSVFRCMGHGVHYRGPHDGILNNILVSRVRGKGIFVEFKPGSFDGSCDADMWHAYGCSDVGVAINAKINTGSRITGENCGREGVLIDSTRACNLSSVSAFDANNKGAMLPEDRKKDFRSFNIRVQSGFHVLSGIRVYDRLESLGGMLIAGDNIIAQGVLVDGHEGEGSGVLNSGNSNQVSGVVLNYSASNGSALHVSEGVHLNRFELSVANCQVALKTSGASMANEFKMSIKIRSEDHAIFDGPIPSEESLNTCDIKAIRRGKIVLPYWK